MRTVFVRIYRIGLLLFLLGCFFTKTAFSATDSLGVYSILIEAETDRIVLQNQYEKQFSEINTKLEMVNHRLKSIRHTNGKKYLKTYRKKSILEDSIRNINAIYNLHLLKIRYRKGVELIKIVYEKTLGLDHHFTGMQTFSNVMMLSNPHSYPDFQKAKAVLEKKAHKKFSLDMPLLFESNPYISATSMLVSTLLSNNKKEEKEKDLEQISCILDFTVRMNSDLNLIRHETEYLKDANRELLLRCETLFTEYTKVIGYKTSLKECRKTDDWERLFEQLDILITSLEKNISHSEGEEQSTKQQVNLEFSMQRVAVFLNQYSDFIILGKQYYQKFDNIISTYEHEEICQDKLPRQFTELKFDIKSTIEKFTNTYDLPELQGSKLKSLLFGVME